MGILGRVAAWCKAWCDFVGYDDIPGYLNLPWGRRKKLDALVLWRGLRTEGFWRAVIFVCMASAIAHILSWRWDLDGPQSDLLRVLSVVLAAPWLVAGRKRHIRALLEAGRALDRATD